jgi:glycogen debranching enzyme
MSWADTCLQQLFSAKLLVAFAGELGRTDDVADFQEEADSLTKLVNDILWDDRTAFYYDRYRDGALSPVQSIGAYWAVIAGIVPEDRMGRFIGHLEDPKKFNRPHRVPSLAADDPDYQEYGDYWRGGIWEPTNYMVLRGLTSQKYDKLAHEIAANHLAGVTQVFRDTGTVWENYAPEHIVQGRPARKDFVGWAGMAPVALLFEYLFGLRPDAAKNALTWDVRLTEGFSVKRYPFGVNGQLDLACAARGSVAEEPQVTIQSNIPVDVEILWEGGSKRMRVG